MLDELKVAAQWNRERLRGRLTDRQLVDMVTSVPARLARIDDEVGAIRVGLRADLLVIGGSLNDPYGAVVETTPAEVQLVLIGGVPLYGDRTLMKRFWKPGDLEELSLLGVPKTLATPAAGLVVAGIAGRLGAALAGEETSLAPLTESVGGVPASAGATGPAPTWRR